MNTPDIRMIPAGEDIQADGARWQILEDAADPGRFTILTSAGYELLSRDRAMRGTVRGLMEQYRAAELGEVVDLGEPSETRHQLGAGGEAIVYSMGRYAVREEPVRRGFHDSLKGLRRMNALNRIIEGGVPRWLVVPTHYAVHVDPSSGDSGRTYTVMEKIDGGLTVEDIANYPATKRTAPHRAKIVEATLGNRVEDAKQKVPELFERAEGVLNAAIRNTGRYPGDLLIDWAPRNAVIEPLHTPIGDSNYRLAVIDQYE
jgi:hypothetical protein